MLSIQTRERRKKQRQDIELNQKSLHQQKQKLFHFLKQQSMLNDKVTP